MSEYTHGRRLYKKDTDIESDESADVAVLYGSAVDSSTEKGSGFDDLDGEIDRTHKIICQCDGSLDRILNCQTSTRQILATIEEGQPLIFKKDIEPQTLTVHPKATIKNDIGGENKALVELLRSKLFCSSMAILETIE